MLSFLKGHDRHLVLLEEVIDRTQERMGHRSHHGGASHQPTAMEPEDDLRRMTDEEVNLLGSELTEFQALVA